MVKSLFGNAIWQLVVQSDTVSKIVLLILLFLSILCWAIFFYKFILYRIKKRQILHVLDSMKRVTSFNGLLTIVERNKHTLPGYFLAKNLSFLKSIATIDPETKKAEISDIEWEIFQQNVDQRIEDIIYQEESYLPILSTSATVSPLLGLFGTVWGLVHAFVRISQQQSADITTVAPGIAEALITTLAGLAVAVPALILFNYCSAQVRKIDQLFTLIADKLIIQVQTFVLK